MLNKELSFIDMLSIASFCIGLQNLELNTAQEDLDNQTQELDRHLRDAVDEIHKHLEEQDTKLNYILERISHE